jgi:hypothetical protein
MLQPIVATQHRLAIDDTGPSQALARHRFN